MTRKLLNVPGFEGDSCELLKFLAEERMWEVKVKHSRKVIRVFPQNVNGTVITF